MSYIDVYNYFKEYDLEDRVLDLSGSSATVDEAAATIGCDANRIAKTMSFLIGEQAILIVTAGKAKIDNKKYKAYFHKKAKMIPGDQVLEIIGHDVGGVCPFVIHDGIDVYLDISLKEFDYVYPAAGNAHSAVKLNLEELEKYSHAKEWIDVSK